ncbi:CysB family HTH-type transcriptional regulator [Taylorella equigenitalis]|uniref:CysB family HTH-type transcriptional regulator n=1 Tax=Taylorella equigenitalis TaxID=29575 RepID=UPI00237DE179|nr:CysB family HTH-type transcriptional regulator [Taylorella equigenitalis]WDU52310.1 CysB family HTH-type transcriptional regulator [Taylorella equigenitalis]
MNIQQFRYVLETVNNNFNLTDAAKKLHTSQPGISKSIIELEEELGFQIFERNGKRLRGLTKPGKAVVSVIRRLILEVENIKRLSNEYVSHDEGVLVIGCTHTQARYFLPEIILDFKKRYPGVQVSLIESSPPQLANMLLNDELDVAFATETLAQVPGVVIFPCYDWQHFLVMREDHELAELTSSQIKELSLEDISKYPLITYSIQFTGRPSIDVAFEKAGIESNIVLEAIDADVIKTYVDVGLGLGIIAGMAYDPRRDRGLIGIPVGHLFGHHISKIGLRKGVFARDYVFEFIRMCAPGVEKKKIIELLHENLF